MMCDAKKNILIIGDTDSFFIEEIISRLEIAAPSISIDILPTNYTFRNPNSGNVRKVFKPSFLIRIIYSVFAFLSHNIAFRCMRFFLSNKLNCIKNKYDSVHIHFLNKNLLYISSEKVLRLSEQLIISLWGSDFYQRNAKEREKMKPYLDGASIITMANEKSLDEFNTAFPLYKSKTKILKFGLSVLEQIDVLLTQKVKKILPDDVNIPNDSLVVTIGYSSHPDQQHFAVLKNMLSGLPEAILKRLFIVFPMTYGSKKYASEIVSFAKKTGLQFVMYRKRMSDSEVALLRINTDVMIHVRKTDQLSGSFQEHLYAGNIVIAGAWLPYSRLIEQGARFFSVSSLAEICDVLRNVIDVMPEEKQKVQCNKSIIRNMSSWHTLIANHCALYE